MENLRTHDEIMVLLEDIHPNPYQPREEIDMDAVKELAENIQRNATETFDGILQAPTARPCPTPALPKSTSDLGREQYELAFGHRRYEAVKYLAQTDDRYSHMRLVVRELSDLQMFEIAVSENIKRRDLNPMEEARAIHTYMTVFGKNSVEAGEFFHKSPEAVRGAIRLVNLPEKAQAKLKDGSINVTDARALLLVDKLGEDVDEVLKDIETAPNGESPMEIIEDALNMSEHTFDLDGEEWARVSPFPVKHIKPLTFDEILNALIIEDDSEVQGKEEEIERIATMISAGMEVTYEAFPTFHADGIERVRVLANPPACEKCPMHAVLNGSHFCGFKPCAERKDAAWDKQKAENVSIATGIPFYAKSDGAHIDLNQYDKNDAKLVEDRHADLRLFPAKNVWNNFDEIPLRDWKVVAVGNLAAKRLKKREAEKAEQPTQRREAETDYRLDGMLRELRWDFEKRFCTELVMNPFSAAFDGLTQAGVLESLIRSVNGLPKVPKGAKKAEQLKALRRILAWDIVNGQLPTEEKKTVERWSKYCEDLAKTWGVKLPKDWNKQVEKFQAEFDAAVKDVKEKRAAEGKKE